MTQSATKNYLMSASEALDVIDFLSCKDYLAALYKTAKSLLKKDTKKSRNGQDNIRYSYLKFAEDLGFGATNVLRLVIVGERPFTVKAAEKVAERLKMNATTRKYWTQLASYENENSPQARDEIFAQLMKYRSKKITKGLDRRLALYFSVWYHPVIREFVECQKIPVDAKVIQDKLSFPLRLDEIKKSLELLVELQFIKKSKGEESFIGSGEQIFTGREVDHIDILLYHQKMIEMAKESMTRIDAERRDIQAATIGIPRHYLPILKERIQQWVAEAMAIDRITKESDEVYQLNIQLFPFTK